MEIDVNDQQPENAALPTETTSSGITIFLKFLQSINEHIPIEFKSFGKFIFSKVLQPKNAPAPISLAE